MAENLPGRGSPRDIDRQAFTIACLRQSKTVKYEHIALHNGII
jgi:hypothetical protein